MGTDKDPAGSIWEDFASALNAAGLSVAKFAEWYEGELAELPDEATVAKRTASLKKQLERKGTSQKAIAQAQAYLNVLHRHPDFVKRVGIAPRNIDYPEMSPRERDRVQCISKKIDELMGPSS